MQYEEALSALRNLERRGSEYGLERVKALLTRLGDPQDKLKIIHVAGTNGKGSVCAYLTQILVLAGKRVGTFTSPAVFDYRERYLIDGRYPEKEALAEALERALAVRGSGTAFETEVGAALWLFAHTGCEYAVVECGCGGKDDATNAVDRKELAILTSVSYDHTALLGSTLIEIARQKLGIVKDCPLITCAQPAEVAEQAAEYRPIIAPPYTGELGLRGAFQPSNAGIAAAAARVLGIPEEEIAAGLRTARLPGRCEVLQADGHTVVLDGAHNPDAAAQLRKSLDALFPRERRYFIMGMFADKDVKGVLAQLLPGAEAFTAVQAPLPRGMKREDLAALAENYVSNVTLSTVSEGIKRALSETGITIVCGSLSILGEARRCIDEQRKSNAGDSGVSDRR